MIRWLALTGTPGVGKSTVARLLRGRGLTVIEGNRFARDNGCVVSWDAQRRSSVVDVGRVGRRLARTHLSGGPAILESHWAHEVPGMDAAIVLRLHPDLLRRRLERRRWNRTKVRENLEAEALDIILQESVQRLGPKRVGEIDTSRLRPETVAARIARVLSSPRAELIKLEIGRIDWSEELLRWS